MLRDGLVGSLIDASQVCAACRRRIDEQEDFAHAPGRAGAIGKKSSDEGSRVSAKKAERKWREEDYPVPEIFTTRDGLTINTRDDQWRIDLERALNWSGAALRSIPRQLVLPLRAYICQVLQDHSGEHARVIFDRLVGGFSKLDPAALSREVASQIGSGLYYALKSGLENDPNISEGTTRDALSSFRRWYVWCTDCELPGFDEETSFALLEKRIGGSPKGKLVLQADPDMGPLTFAEDTRLEVALTQSLDRLGDLERDELQACVAVMLSKAFGLYGKHLQLLDEEAFSVERIDGGALIYWLNVPRLKKRGGRSKVGTRRRRLTARMGEAVQRLIDGNREDLQRCAEISLVAKRKPLFVRPKGRVFLTGTALQGDAYRWGRWQFNEAMREFCASHRLSFSISPRRLRYSFATRLVEEGCSPLELADALDHTDLQHVMVYFNSRGRVVRQLDEAMAIRLAPFALAFLGTIVPERARSTRASDPASVIRFPVSAENQPDVGSCGSFRGCGLNAPLACYSCWRFEPWADAPHDMVLAALVLERKRRQSSGLDDKLVQVHDTTILAVAEVVRRCEMKIQADG